MKTRRTRGTAALAGAALAVALVPMVSAPGASAAADDLFFSEYVEGSSNNKALEIANETGATIDLGAQGVNVQMYFNGSSSAGLTIQLTGTVADGDVYVLAQSSAVSDILGVADQTNGAGWFNGDDAVVLRRGTAVLDVIGQIGSDPGSQWGSGDTSTQDNTLRRLASVCAGDTDGSDAFDPAAEWAGFAQNTFDDLGAHVSDCGDGGGNGGSDLPVINEFVADHTGSDAFEFVEVLGQPNTDLGDHTILEIEGDGSGAGTIDEVIAVGTTDGAGFWDTGFLSNAIENGTITLLLVEGFSGAFGDDLDTDNDGTLDVTPWTAVVDAVGVDEGGFVYGVPGLGPNFDGLSSFAPGGASRIPDGVDTDTAADWLRNDFDLAGIGDIAGTPVEGEALNTPGAPNEAYEPPPGGVCGDPATAIHDIQGSGLTFDPAFGGVQSVEGVITQLAPGLNGLYVQQDDADQDGDPATSEGIFVFLGSDPASTLATGDVVRVTGTVGEYVTSGGASSQTQLTGGPVVTPCDAAGTVTPTEVSFPLTDPGDLERYEGMLVELGQELVISEYFNFDRFGEVVVSLPPDGWDRLFTPTAVVDPGAEANALADEYALRRITIDDVRSNQNPVPAIHPGNGEDLATDNIFRGGDTITGIEGVVDETFGRYRVQPTTYGEFEVVNPRPAVPEDVGGDVQVASLNVLNYFLTLDTGPDICGPDQDQDCRGANDTTELERQRTKILATLAGLDADVVGLVELENTTGVDPAADLVAGLNDLVGAGTYASLDTGVIGTDAIRVGMIYKPAAVSPVGDFAILDSSVDARFLDDFNRPVLAQSFVPAGGSSDRVFTVAVNHLKSKGSPCDAVGDPNAFDGQGNCNLTRTAAAEALADWLADDPTGSGSPDALIVGDLNAYDREDPITALVAAGYTDLVKAFGGELAYSYVFDGQFGYLDHALASPSLVAAVTGATEWHINADEADIWDYDTSFNDPSYFEPNAFRSSDHDPVLVGLDLTPPSLDVTVSPDELWPPNHKYVDVTATIVVSDETDPAPTVRLVSVTSNEPDNGADDGNTVDDIVVVDDTNFRLRAERSGSGTGRVYTITYEATDAAGNTTTAEATVTVPLRR